MSIIFSSCPIGVFTPPFSGVAAGFSLPSLPAVIASPLDADAAISSGQFYFGDCFALDCSGYLPSDDFHALAHTSGASFHPFARFADSLTDAVHFSSVTNLPNSAHNTSAINGSIGVGGENGGNGGGDDDDDGKINFIKQETAELGVDIRNEITQWQERYGKEGTREEIERRLQILEGEMVSVQEIGYARDILDAYKILWNRVIREERRLFRETQKRRSFKVSLYGDKEAETPQKPSKPPSEESIIRRIITRTRQELGAIIQTLIAKRRADFEISLRDHQWRMLNGIQEDWAVHHAHRASRVGWPKLNSVVVAPTGSGKTHVMGAAIELGIKEGRLEFNKGAKAVILTHLKQISRQNVDRMKELLNPVFRKHYNRDVEISIIGEGIWDVSGDVIIASVPTVGAERNLARLQESFIGLKNLLVLEDEYHHAVAKSWRDALSRIKSAVSRGYVIGFTATLPPEERVNVNIVSELTPTELMRDGVLPAVELYQVFTGVDMQRIPTTRGEFNPTELSQSVRNIERYEHGMMALEFNGVRKPGHALSPTLIFGVDIAHINELARYYQIYFARERRGYIPKEGAPIEIKSLGVRHIAVIDDSMSEAEIDRILEDYRGGNKSHFRRYEAVATAIEEAGDYVETKIDGIVAVLTGDTSSKVRQKILEASQRGHVEAIINAKVFGEGFDGWWIQNLLGARPSLKYIQKAQEGGRVLRYGPKEISPDGRVMESRRRVAIDLIDVRSGLQTYHSVYGVSGRSYYGRKIDVATGTTTGSGGYGGIKDVYDINGDEYQRRQVTAGLRLEELKLIRGEREHYLLPESEAGALGLRLREILNKDYGRHLDEMAFDLAITEEMLVGYMNGGVPEEERIARRMGIFLYKGRNALLDSYTEARLNWTPLEEIPEDRRELVAIVRRHVIEAFGGRLPINGFTTADGSFSGHLQHSPLHNFLRSGKIEYSHNNAPSQFWEKVDKVLFVERRSDGIHYIGMDEEAKRLRDRLISKLEGWASLEEISEDKRELVAIARKQVIETFGGRLPRKGFTTADGSFSGQLPNSPLHDFLRSGKIEYSNRNTPAQFWGKVDKVLFVERRSDGIYHIGMDEEAKRLRDKLISKLEGWTPLEEISEDRRGLVAIARRQVIEAFGGRLPSMGFTTADGFFSGRLPESPLHDFLRYGKIRYTANNAPSQFWEKADKILFVEQQSNGIHYIGMDEEAKRLKDQLISKLEGWLSLEEISEDKRELVAIARRQVITAFGGRLPSMGFTTADGFFSGKLHGSPLHDFLRFGKIEYSANNIPSQFWEKADKILFVERIDDGGYRHVALDPRTAELLANLQSIGEAAWRAVKGRNKIVFHP